MQTPGTAVRGSALERLGRYLLGREIGRGGMGSVYEATHDALAKPVAIKRFHPHLTTNPDSLTRFVGEGRAIAQVRHAHVVEVFDLDEENGAPYLVMELLEGCTLAEHLARGAELSLPEAIDLALPLVSALSAAHAVGVVHRDVKPSNVFLRRGSLADPCIIDFGVSKHASHVAAEELTQSGTLVGSYPYFSPEHTRGAKSVIAQSDQYSLAAVLYECVTGVRPFQGDSAYELMHAIATRDVRPPSELCARIPREFDDVLLRAMHRDPAHRYPTMRAFGAALLGFASRRSWFVWATELAALSTEGGSIERTADEKLPVARSMPRRSVRPSMLVAIGLATALLCVGASALMRPAAGNRAPQVVVSPPSPETATGSPVVQNVPTAHASAAEPIVHAAPSATIPPRPQPAPATAPPQRAERGSNGVAIFD